MKVEDIMSGPVWVVKPEDSVLHARNEMISRGVKKLPVVADGGHLAGMLSLWDIAFGAGDVDSARARNRSVVLDKRVENVMTPSPFTLEPGLDAKRAAREFLNRNIQAAPVTAGGVLQGIVTESDFLRGFVGTMNGSHVVGEIMTPEVATVHRHTAVPRALSVMHEKRVHQLPVEESAGVLVGMVTLSNIVFGHWLDPGQRITKRITTVHKTEAGGRKGARHVDEVHAVVEDVMTQGVETARVDQGMRAVANILTHHGFNALPVLEGETPVGIVTRRDLLTAIVQETEREVRPSITYEGHRHR